MEGTSGQHREVYEQRQPAGVPAELITPFSPPEEQQAEITSPAVGSGLDTPRVASPHISPREKREAMPSLSTGPKPESALFAQAYEYAGVSTDAQTYLVEKAPDTDQTALDIYHAADGWREGADGNRNKIYTAVSMGRTALKNQAWSKALDLAVKRGAADVGLDGSAKHALEAVVAPQVQETRLRQVKNLGEKLEDPTMSARVVGAAAARLAAIGETDEALKIIDRIPVSVTNGLESNDLQVITDRARVAVVDRLASEDRFATSSETLAALESIKNPGMRAWAQLKIAGRMDGNDPGSIRWEEVNTDLPSFWGSFQLADQLQIVDDILGSGRTDNAAKYALALDDPHNSTVASRQAQADKVIEVAKTQRLNPDAAAVTLIKFKNYTVGRLSAIGGYRPDGLTEAQRIEQTEERFGYLGQITAAELAIKASWNPSDILPALDKAYFQGEKAVEYHDKACAEVAAVVARNGDTQKALKIIERIGWYPLRNGIKSRALTDVGRAVYDYRTEHERGGN